jgi:hypothetical protein
LTDSKTHDEAADDEHGNIDRSSHQTSRENSNYTTELYRTFAAKVFGSPHVKYAPKHATNTVDAIDDSNY